MLDRFKDITSFDIEQYFTDYNYFISNKLQFLVAYYKGSYSIEREVFERLFNLLDRSETLDELTSLFSSQLSSTTQFWDLLTNISETKTKLWTILNLSKWLRSAYISSYENNLKVSYVMKQRQTFENLSYNIGDVDPNNSWVQLAVDNSVLELDYTKDGGTFVKIRRPDTKAIDITSVVDVMVGDNILGKDLTKKITISEDDILSLIPISSVNQSADICLSVMKGSVPEFPDLGIAKSFIGSNTESLRLSSLIRDIKTNFKTDDAFRSIEVIDSDKKDDSIFFNLSILTKLNTELNKSI